MFQRSEPTRGTSDEPQSAARLLRPSGLHAYVGNNIFGHKGHGDAMFIFAPLHLVVTLIPAAIVLLILYWVVRLAVRHGVRDSRKK